MTQAEINDIVKRANLVLPTKYQSFVECVWNESQRFILYSFRSVVDAEQFVLWKQTLNTTYKLRTEVHHANWTSVSEYIPENVA